MNATRVERREKKADSRHARRGFTLVELMVVIGIIVILISILGVTLSHMGQQAKEAATNTTITKIHRMLEQRMEAFDRAMNQTEKNASRDRTYQQARSNAITELNNLKVSVNNAQLKILVRKRFKQANFPQSFAEAGVTAPTGHTADTESSEVLYSMLTEGEVGGAAPVDAGEFLASEVGDTDGDGLIEFIDAWGSPLRFYRWPTRLFKDENGNHLEGPAKLLVQGLPQHNSATEDLLDSDPDDPLEKLAGVITALADTSTSFESLYHTPYTYHVPLIVSAGVDLELGMGEPNSATLAHRLGQVTDSDLILDNFTNRNQRSGD
jgi:prepilin-type N-terminal cleavage/methylation domain-containing protein